MNMTRAKPKKGLSLRHPRPEKKHFLPLPMNSWTKNALAAFPAFCNTLPRFSVVYLSIRKPEHKQHSYTA